MPSSDALFEAGVVDAARRRLEQLGEANPAITLAVLTSEDGFEIASWRGHAISARIAAMSSSLQALSEAMAREAGLSNSRNLVIEAENGTIVVMAIAGTAPRVSLAVVASKGENLGQLLWAARNCCQSLESTFRS
jgi:uncharacterized protein